MQTTMSDNVQHLKDTIENLEKMARSADADANDCAMIARAVMQLKRVLQNMQVNDAFESDGMDDHQS